MRAVVFRGAMFLLLSLIACSKPVAHVMVDSVPTVDTTTLDFGLVADFTSKTLSLSLSNQGSAPLQLLRAEVDPQLSGTVAVTLGSTQIKVGENALLQVTFSPTLARAFSGTLTLFTDSKATPSLVVQVLGQGVGAGLLVTPSALQFPLTEVGSSATLPLHVVNDSERARSIALTLSGSMPGMFTYALPDPSATTLDLQPGEAADVAVTFAPTRVLNAFTAQLQLKPCTSCESTSVRLTGPSLDSFLSVTPSDCLNFGELSPGASVTKTVRLSNRGTQPISILEVSLTNDTDVFSVTPIASSIEGRGELSFDVTYHPIKLSNNASTLELSTSDVVSPTVKICMKGSSSASGIHVSPTALDFSTVAVGIPATQSVHIQNQGYGSHCGLQILDARVVIPAGSPTQPGEFNVNWGPLPTVNSCGVQADWTVTYAPVDSGNDLATLEITSNDPANPVVQVPLSGSGRVVPPCSLSVSPSSGTLDFGTIDANQTARLSLVLENTGSGDCLLSGLGLRGDSSPTFSFVGSVPAFTTLAPGAQLAPIIEFNPANGAGQVTGNVEFNVSDPLQPHRTIALQASSGSGCLFAVPKPIEFGTVSLGCASPTQTITIYSSCSNTGTTQLKSIRATHDQSPFSLVAPPTWPRTITAKTQLTVQVRDVPVRAGEFHGGLLIDTDKRPEPYFVPLHGTAVTGAPTQVDSWQQPASNKADVLFVVEDSISTVSTQTALSQNIGVFLSSLNAAGVDYRIAVTGDGRYSRFAPSTKNPIIVNPGTPNAEQVLGQNLLVGQSGTVGRADLAVARWALDPNALQNSNTGFLRDDAQLVIIFVNDAPDYSPQSTSYYAAYFSGLKGFRRANLLRISAIADIDPASVNYGQSYVDLAQATSGLTTSIHTKDWPKDLQLHATAASNVQPQYVLTTTPADPTQLTCDLNGRPFPATNGATTNWSYVSSPPSLLLNPLATSSGNQVLTCHYAPLCATP